jgi:hypothetical protein
MGDKTPLSSKKFVAFLIAEASWKVLIGGVLYLCSEQLGLWMPVILTMVLVSGFMEAAYIGGQAILDKYVRVAQAATSGAAQIATGGLMGHRAADPDEEPEDLSSWKLMNRKTPHKES